MNVLGLSYGYHDSSAAIVIDGQLVAASSEERHSRQKHDSFYPELSIQACLDQCNLTLEDIDQVAYYEKSSEKWSRVLSTTLSHWPFNYREFKTSMKAWLGGKLWHEASLINTLDIDDDKLTCFDHHLSHAAQAFIGSGFQEANILTVDAVGEWETCTLYQASWVHGKPQFNKVISSEYPHSLGLFYSAITDYLGFKPMSDECSTMALAAFGQNDFLEQMQQCVSVDEGVIKLNGDFFNFNQYYQKPYTEKFIETFGAPAQKRYDFSSFESIDVDQEQQRLANIAWAAQRVFEDCVLKLIDFLNTKSPSSHLCLAGGGALNCVANTRIINETSYEDVYIPTEPGDGGAALGAAFLGYFQGSDVQDVPKPFPVGLGKKHDISFLHELASSLEPRKLQKFRKISSQKNTGVIWNTQTIEQEEQLTQQVAEHIHHGKVVAWVQGPGEFGPRALGYRSLLFKADDLKLAKRVSTVIKDRAAFRPYALSMTEKEAQRVLDCDNVQLTPFQFMQLATPIKSEFRSQLRAGLHIDGTTRPQVVRPEGNRLYHQLLTDYGHLSGHEALINTSLNESGYPIVEGPNEALLMFARTNIDILVYDNVVIEKVLP